MDGIRAVMAVCGFGVKILDGSALGTERRDEWRLPVIGGCCGRVKDECENCDGEELRLELWGIE